jgi:methyltransferase-like protein/ubiquinone/menaquinone biosynthesis C-methylase UbiE
MNLSTQETYEDVPYPSYMHSQTHPDRLAVMAKLFGMNPAPLQKCRVLELGCGDGGGLIAFANSLPESEFLGIDLGAKHIEAGQQMINALELKNVKLTLLDAMKIDETFGKFDYIIAHGMFSWVPDFVREKMLEICSVNLNPRGVVYISYNAMPGSHLRQMAREMMIYHVKHIQEPLERAKQATSLMKFLAESFNKQDPYRLFLKNELDNILDKRTENILHDDLAEINQPFYFHEFMEKAEAHNLQFLSEADFIDMQDYFYPEEVRKALDQLKDNVTAREQYFDFVKGRRFRQTLLCHKDVGLKRDISSDVVREFFIASPARPNSEQPDITGRRTEKFVGLKGAEVTTDNPLIKAALLHLGKAWPRYLKFEEVLKEARKILEKTDETDIESDRKTLSELLLEIFRSALVEFHLYHPQFTLEVSEKPVASKFARYQLLTTPIVTTLRCANLFISDAFSRHLVQMLDGTRDRQALIKELTEWVESGALEKEGEAISDKEKFLEQLPDELERNLSKLGWLTLLEK